MPFSDASSSLPFSPVKGLFTNGSGVQVGRSAGFVVAEMFSGLKVGRRDSCDKALLFAVIKAGTFSQISGLFLYFIGISLFYSFDQSECKRHQNTAKKGMGK